MNKRLQFAIRYKANGEYLTSLVPGKTTYIKTDDKEFALVFDTRKDANDVRNQLIGIRNLYEVVQY